LDAVWKDQEALKLKRRRLESEFVKLHAKQEAMSAREWASIAEVAALEEGEASPPDPVVLEASQTSSPPAPESGEDPLDLLNFDLDYPAACVGGHDFSLGELDDGTAGFVLSPS
jgi:hypothetical protein